MQKASGILQDDTMLGMEMRCAEVGSDDEASDARVFVRLLNGDERSWTSRQAEWAGRVAARCESLLQGP
jgi:hypothetical protein